MNLTQYRHYATQLDAIRAQVLADFEYWNGLQSIIDRRLNELGKRGNIEAVADDMAELLKYRKIAKEAALSLLPLRDFFESRRECNDWAAACERLERYEANKHIKEGSYEFCGINANHSRVG